MLVQALLKFGSGVKSDIPSSALNAEELHCGFGTLQP